jgi:hypothetical protein
MLVRWLDSLLRPGRALWTGLIALLLLVGMGAKYADFAAHQRQGFQWCLENPEPCDGREILLPVWGVVGVDEKAYTVFKVTGPIPISGNPEGLEVGDTVSIRGHFSKNSETIIEASREIHQRRPLKKALSGFGLLICIVAAPLCLRFRQGRLYFRG